MLHSTETGAASPSLLSALTMVPTLPAGGIGLGSASQLFHSSRSIPVRTLSLWVDTASDLSSHGARESSDSRAICISSFSSVPD